MQWRSLVFSQVITCIYKSWEGHNQNDFESDLGHIKVCIRWFYGQHPRWSVWAASNHVGFHWLGLVINVGNDHRFIDANSKLVNCPNSDAKALSIGLITRLTYPSLCLQIPQLKAIAFLPCLSGLRLYTRLRRPTSWPPIQVSPRPPC